MNSRQRTEGTSLCSITGQESASGEQLEGMRVRTLVVLFVGMGGFPACFKFMERRGRQTWVRVI